MKLYLVLSQGEETDICTDVCNTEQNFLDIISHCMLPFTVSQIKVVRKQHPHLNIKNCPKQAASMFFFLEEITQVVEEF